MDSADSLRAQADARLDSALGQGHWADPRAYYRERLRALKNHRPVEYEEATRYYEDVLVPRIAKEEVEPLAGWFEFGGRLAETGGPGKLYTVDRQGKATESTLPPPPSGLTLHIPEARELAPLVIAKPSSPSPAQQATYDLLVLGRTEIRTAE